MPAEATQQPSEHVANPRCIKRAPERGEGIASARVGNERRGRKSTIGETVGDRPDGIGRWSGFLVLGRVG